MKEITLSMGQVALVDDSDYEMLSKYKWHVLRHKDGRFYAFSCLGKHRGRVSMHRYILGLNRSSIVVDHRDGNGLNNQRYNIRTCTRSQNQMNSKKRAGCSSKYIGVNRKNDRKWVYWRATIRINGKGKELGYFPFTEEGEIQAAKLRDEAAKKYHGEFAKLNFE